MTANGATASGPVWTGGPPANIGGDGENCTNWTATNFGRVGIPSTSTQSMFDDGNMLAGCGFAWRIYCLED